MEEEIEVTISNPVVSNFDFDCFKKTILEIIEKLSGDAHLEMDNGQKVFYLCVQDFFAEIRAFEIMNKDIPETQKETLVQSRIGQGKFRADLVEFWGGCSTSPFSWRLSGLVLKPFMP